METVVVNYLSKARHISQILCGFHMLDRTKYNVVLNDRCSFFPDTEFPAAAEVIYEGKRIIYDTDDGYQRVAGIRKLLSECDYYFKRSFSNEMNEAWFSEYKHKMFPLGFNYHISYKDNPINEEITVSEAIKHLFGYQYISYYTYDKFEGEPAEIKKGMPKILFYARLWRSENSLSKELNDQRAYINETRMGIVRELRKNFGKAFKGGIIPTQTSTRLCPELLVSRRQTLRHNYLRILHDSDICIGTMGLHESIGWKTGEYVASAKAIVTENLKYSVPGDFREGNNYLSFTSVDECVKAVQRLVDDHELLMKMKFENYKYYRKYLHPAALIENTLNIVRETDRQVVKEKR